MIVREITQKSNEWHEWRKGRICASDLSVIMMRQEAFKTPLHLYYEKTEFPNWYPVIKDNNFIFEKGNKLEEEARTQYNIVKKVCFVPTCIESDCGRFGASLDGYYAEEHRAVEVKFMGKDAINDIINNDKIPEHYNDQIQFQLAVCELESIDLLAINDKQLVVHTVYRDDNLIADLLIAASEFYDRIQNKEPPALTKNDYMYIDNILINDELYLKKTAFKKITEEAKLLETRIKELEKELTANVVTDNIVTNNLIIKKTTRAGAVDYSQIIDKNLNLDNYRKPSTSFWTTKIIGE